MLIAQWQYAVTRVDMAETFSFKDFKEVSFKITGFFFCRFTSHKFIGQISLWIYDLSFYHSSSTY
jgi:hypothetical protein